MISEEFMDMIKQYGELRQEAGLILGRIERSVSNLTMLHTMKEEETRPALTVSRKRGRPAGGGETATARILRVLRGHEGSADLETVSREANIPERNVAAVAKRLRDQGLMQETRTPGLYELAGAQKLLLQEQRA